MAISERERHQLHQSLDRLMGADVAAILMSHLPPVGWADVATKHDLAELEGRLTNMFRAELRGEVGGLRREMHTEIGTLRREMHTEIGTLRREMHAEIGKLRSEMNSAIGTLRREMNSEIGTLRSEMNSDIGSLRGEMTETRREIAQLHETLQAATRTQLLGTVGAILTVTGIAFGAASLI